MSAPVLLAVAHGSRDPSAQRCAHAIARQAGRLDPGIDVRVAFLGNAEPALPGALARAVAGAGAGRVTVVPMLLAAGYHVSADIGRTACRAGVAAGAPLGPDPALVPVLAARLARAGTPAGTPVVLAAAGSQDPRAARDTERQAAMLAGHLGVPVRTGYLSAARPSVDEAVASLAAQTGGPVAVAAFLLAPGMFHDRLRRVRAAWVSGPLAAHPALPRLVLDRFRSARGGTPP